MSEIDCFFDEEDEDNSVPMGQEITEWFFAQFDEEDDAFQDASYFIIGIRCKEGDYSEKDEFLLRTLIGLRRLGNEPEVVMIKNNQKDGIYATCFMAALK